MKQSKLGFTLIEVVLFIALSGALFAGIITSTSISINKQRYNDSVQGFAEFLRSIYSEAANVQNIVDEGKNQHGRSEKAIYGKLITFGETYNLEGKENTDNSIFVYNIIGDISSNPIGADALTSLAKLNANIGEVIVGEGISQLSLIGSAYAYTPTYGARIEKTKNNELFKGAIMVVRSPLSGTFYTYILDSSDHTVEVNRAVFNHDTTNPLTQYLSHIADHSFTTKQMDLCISSDDVKLYDGLRRDIRLNEGIRNSSGIEMVEMNDESNNQCKVIQEWKKVLRSSN